MKTIKSFIFLSLLFSFPLHAAEDVFHALDNDIVHDFFIKQLSVEEKISDHTLTDTVIDEIIEGQSQQYHDFLVGLVADDVSIVEMGSSDIAKIAEVRKRIKLNKQQENEYAVLRDEIKLNSWQIYRSMRQSLHKMVAAAGAASHKEFKEEIDTIIVNRYNDIAMLDATKYQFSEEELTSSSVLREIQGNLTTNKLLMQVNTTLTMALAENAEAIYNTALLSDVGLYTISQQVNASVIGRSLNPGLSYVKLDSGKIVLIVSIVLLAGAVRFMILLLWRRLWRWLFATEADVKLMLAETSGYVTLIVLVSMLHFIVIIYTGFSNASWLLKLFQIIYVVLLMLLLYNVTNTLVAVKIEAIERTSAMRKEVINLGLKVIKILFLLLVLIIALNIANVDLTAILSGLGIGGFAVAIAAKESIANIFGSVSILMSDLFQQGDWIDVSDIEGTVVEIGLRATTIRTFDNALISVPNYKLADNALRNWTRRRIGRRIKMTISVTYQSNFDDIRRAVQAIRTMLREHPDITSERTQFLESERTAKLVSKEDLRGVKRTMLVYLDAFSASGIDILVYCFSRSVVWNEWLETKEDVLYKIADILKKNNLEFAYPTMTLFHEGYHEQAKLPEKRTTGVRAPLTG